MQCEPARQVYRTWMIDSRRWSAYRPRSGDVIIATYPKCGTTWMQRIVGLLIFQSPEPRPVGEIAAWVDRRLDPLEAIMHGLESQSHRRFLKSHLPFDGMPIYSDVRYIHVARDGRDACLSYHNQITRFREDTLRVLDDIGLRDEWIGRTYPRVATDPRAYFRMWMQEGVAGASDGSPYLSYFDFEGTYWQARRRPNLLMVHYRDLKSDLDQEMRRSSLPRHSSLRRNLAEPGQGRDIRRDAARGREAGTTSHDVVLRRFCRLLPKGGKRPLARHTHQRGPRPLRAGDIQAAFTIVRPLASARQQSLHGTDASRRLIPASIGCSKAGIKDVRPCQCCTARRAATMSQWGSCKLASRTARVRVAQQRPNTPPRIASRDARRGGAPALWLLGWGRRD